MPTQDALPDLCIGLEQLSDQRTDLFFVAAATKKRLPGNAKDLDNDEPHGQAAATFRTLI